MRIYQVLHQRVSKRPPTTIGQCIAEHFDIEGRVGYDSNVSKLLLYICLSITIRLLAPALKCKLWNVYVI